MIPTRTLLKLALAVAALAAIAAIVPLLAGALAPLDAAAARLLHIPAHAPGAAPALQIVLTLLAAAAIGWTSVAIRHPLLKILVGALAIAELFGLACVTALYGLPLSPVPASLAAAVALLLGLALSPTLRPGGAQSLERFLEDRAAPALLREIQQLGGLAQLGGEPREATALVCEIVNSHELLESLPPAKIAALHDDTLSRLATFLVRRGAILEGCDAQGVRALFIATPRHPHPTVGACEVALDALQRLREWNAESTEHHRRALDIRLGIESGPAVPATIGTERNRSLTFLTPAWSTARRVARANLNYGSTIIVSSRVYELAAPKVEARPLDLLQMPEARAPLEIYELLARRGEFSMEEAARRDSFWKGVIYFREGRYSDALAMFRLAGGGRKADAPLEFYLERARYALSTPEISEPDPIEEL